MAHNAIVLLTFLTLREAGAFIPFMRGILDTAVNVSSLSLRAGWRCYVQA